MGKRMTKQLLIRVDKHSPPKTTRQQLYDLARQAQGSFVVEDFQFREQLKDHGQPDTEAVRRINLS